MNKQFVIKLMQAKQLEYEAFKEIMPEKMTNRVNKLRDELMEVAVECFKAYRGAGDNYQESENGEKTRVNKVSIE